MINTAGTELGKRVTRLVSCISRNRYNRLTADLETLKQSCETMNDRQELETLAVVPPDAFVHSMRNNRELYENLNVVSRS